MLIAQNSHATSRAQQLNHGLKSCLAIEQRQTSAAASAMHMSIDKTIAQLLINTRGRPEPENLRHELGKQFPRPHVTQNQNDGDTRTKVAIYGIEIFGFNPFQDFFNRHHGKFDATEKIRAQALKMMTR